MASLAQQLHHLPTTPLSALPSLTFAALENFAILRLLLPITNAVSLLPLLDSCLLSVCIPSSPTAAWYLARRNEKTHVSWERASTDSFQCQCTAIEPPASTPSLDMLQCGRLLQCCLGIESVTGRSYAWAEADFPVAEACR
ncbi:hypothetical protein CC80DRAFT_50282 [Byssothecium circinans]|uniref:Uncharacterized protein n=1 Tax=Byssothecium circinans TaxID=147558 RepID=A0A6A5U709_9PLEO|nr:hypothetical protein CC80DRAFT_50282 [Byssothecium circinans]